MGRVEKYAEYRKEIQNSFQNVSTKERSSSRVEKIKKEKRINDNSMNYDDVMEAYEIYNTGEKSENRKPRIKKKRIVFITIDIIIIMALIVALIFVGIKAFGGN